MSGRSAEPAGVSRPRGMAMALPSRGPKEALFPKMPRGGAYRNRRIGEFLKELDLTEGRSTGIPKILRVMKTNGSPPPEFESDEDRTSFLIRLPVHPRAEGRADSPAVTSRAQSNLVLAVLHTEPLSMREIADSLGP